MRLRAEAIVVACTLVCAACVACIAGYGLKLLVVALVVAMVVVQL